MDNIIKLQCLWEKNGTIDTIYNIGILDNMTEKNRSKSSVTAQRPLSQMTNEEDSSSIKRDSNYSVKTVSVANSNLNNSYNIFR